DLSLATHVALPPGQFVALEITVHSLPDRRAASPFCVVTQIAPRSSQTERIDSKGKPDSVLNNSTVRGRSRFRPPPTVPAQMFPSRSWIRLEISRCDVCRLSMPESSRRNNPFAVVPIH